jgi:hypothetical protein
MFGGRLIAELVFCDYYVKQCVTFSDQVGSSTRLVTFFQIL